MSWRERLRTNQSNAEMTLLQALQDNNIRFISQQPIILDYENQEQTIPDATILRDTKRPIPIYLHGPVHLKGKSLEWDKYVEETLLKLNYEPLTFYYRPPLSKKRLAEIIAKIKEVI
jgi:hypothetical protein